MPSYALHWFRRDLRVAGNPALAHAWKASQGRVLGFFCFDPTFLKRPDFSVNRFRFFLETLAALKEELRNLGSDLLVLDGGPEASFKTLWEELPQAPSLVTFNRDYEPFARARDEKITGLLRPLCEVWTEADHVLIEPEDVTKKDGAYQVFTPFQRKWLEAFTTEKVQTRIDAQKAGLGYLQGRISGKTQKLFSLDWERACPRLHKADQLAVYLDKVKSTVPLPPAGSLAAYRVLQDFAPKLAQYGKNRDFPSEAGTSHFSIYLKNGSLTIAQAIAGLGLKGFGKHAASGRDKFLSELIWREFYYAVLYHFPHVEHTAFQERFKDIAWENRADWFEAWKEGRTGYPLVDAGMRQLKQTGWMHNRVRMVVASFLTKDLLIDWKWGERHFMHLLLDGDLAPNNGGWQWAASTGCDAQPYFRIFNPYLQSQKFDPKGDYIRKYVPELSGLTAKQIHEPPQVRGYPSPIVDHAVMRAKALALYGEKK
ncbi:DNA photolyase family protein [bacterium]|nr:DNA photolyase family protein [bacterium]